MFAGCGFSPPKSTPALDGLDANVTPACAAFGLGMLEGNELLVIDGSVLVIEGSALVEEENELIVEEIALDVEGDVLSDCIAAGAAVVLDGLEEGELIVKENALVVEGNETSGINWKPFSLVQLISDLSGIRPQLFSIAVLNSFSIPLPFQ